MANSDVYPLKTPLQTLKASNTGPSNNNQLFSQSNVKALKLVVNRSNVKINT